jgi:hypothetical protein
MGLSWRFLTAWHQSSGSILSMVYHLINDVRHVIKMVITELI